MEESEEEPFEEERSEEEPFEEEPSEEPFEEEPSEEEPFEEEPYEEEPFEEEPYQAEPSEENLCEAEPNEEASSRSLSENACQGEQDDEPFEEEDLNEEPSKEPEEEPSEVDPSERYADYRPYNSDNDEDSVRPNAWKMKSTDIMAKRASESHGIDILKKSENLSSNLVVSEKVKPLRISLKRKQTILETVTGDPGPKEGYAHESTKKRSITCSNDESGCNMPGAVKLPDFVFDPEFQKLHMQASEIMKRLLAKEVVDDRPEDQRSPSPPPTYDSLGNKVNPRKSRLREKLMMQRQTIISELVDKFPGFKPPPDYKKPKLSKKIYIPVQEYPGYDIIGPIIGPQGTTQKRMQKETGARILIRGKGFIRKHQQYNPDPSDNEDLHVFIEAESQSSLDAAAGLVEKLLIPVKEECNIHKLTQLRELAEQNKTVKENNSINHPCGFCQAGHPTSICPLATSASTLGANTNGHQVSFPDNLGGGLSVFSSSMPPSTTMLPMANPGCNSMKPQKEIDYSNLYVGYLPLSVNENTLIELFSPFGEICQLRLMRDNFTGISKGYGFVRYTDHVNASMAIANMNGYQIDGHMLAVRVAGITPSAANTNTVFLSYNQIPNYPYTASTAQYYHGSMYWPNTPGDMSDHRYWQGPPGYTQPEPDPHNFMSNSFSLQADPFTEHPSVSSSCHSAPSSSMLYGFPTPNETAQFSSHLMTLGRQPQLEHESMLLNSSLSSQAHSVHTLGSDQMPPPSDLSGDPAEVLQAPII